MWRRNLAPLLLALVVSVVACGGDNGITFPTADAELLVEACIRGELPVRGDASQSGSITDDDCTEGFDDGFWEGWRVRVSEQKTYTIEITSNFDSWLEVFRIGNITDPENTASLIGEDDDGGVDLDARLSVSLTPDVDYVVFVSGYDQSETGSYTLSIR